MLNILLVSIVRDVQNLNGRSGMRQIKFRAWDGTKMIEVNSLEYISANKSLTGEEGYNVNYHLGIPTEYLMQYTGLKDKNGKEIYEKDILYNEYKNAVVKFSKILSAWVGDNGETEYQMLGAGCFEVIGNIYQNPELLETI